MVLAACGQAAEPTTTTTTVTTTTTTTVPTTTTTAPTTTTTVPPTVWPLTGLPAEPEQTERRAIAIKIDNHPSARPQSGLEVADTVFELLVEGGTSRFLAVFHSTDSDYIGPVRSGRPTDPTLVKPIGAVFAISGAQDWVTSKINTAKVPLIGDVRPGMFRISSRVAPHNLYTDSNLLRGVADRRELTDDPPVAMWEFGPMPEGAEEATDIEMSFSSNVLAGWTWTGAGYDRETNGVVHSWIDKGGNRTQISVETLVVLFVEQYTASPPAGVGGSSVPASQTLGSGRALVFADGKVIEGSWSRYRITDNFELSTPEGETMHVPPGRSWISLVPTGRRVSW